MALDFMKKPIAAAIRTEKDFSTALHSDADMIFLLHSNIMTVHQYVKEIHSAGKKAFVHVDFAEGIGKDRVGVDFLASHGVDGIISTRGQIIRHAKEIGLITVQRFFALDSKGVSGMGELLEQSKPDLIEIMPGIMGKIIHRFAGGKIPVIAGGLIETKAEVTEALHFGAVAVSTGKQDLWYS